MVNSPLLGSGMTIRSEESPSFSDLLTKVGAISDDATALIADVHKNLNQISGNANTLLGNLNDVTGPKNRQNISAALEGVNGTITNANGTITNVNGLITRSSPKIEAIVTNLPGQFREDRPADHERKRYHRQDEQAAGKRGCNRHGKPPPVEEGYRECGCNIGRRPKDPGRCHGNARCQSPSRYRPGNRRIPAAVPRMQLSSQIPSNNGPTVLFE